MSLLYWGARNWTQHSRCVSPMPKFSMKQLHREGCGCTCSSHSTSSRCFVPHVSGYSLTQQWHFFPPVSVQVLPSLPHPFHISVPFVARATSSHSFIGSLALLICCYFPFWYFLLHFSSKILFKNRKAKKILISFQVISFPHSPSLQLFQVKLPFLEHGTLYFQWAFMSTWYQSSNTSLYGNYLACT